MHGVETHDQPTNSYELFHQLSHPLISAVPRGTRRDLPFRWSTVLVLQSMHCHYFRSHRTCKHRETTQQLQPQTCLLASVQKWLKVFECTGNDYPLGAINKFHSYGFASHSRCIGTAVRAQSTLIESNLIPQQPNSAPSTSIGLYLCHLQHCMVMCNVFIATESGWRLKSSVTDGFHVATLRLPHSLFYDSSLLCYDVLVFHVATLFFSE